MVARTTDATNRIRLSEGGSSHLSGPLLATRTTSKNGGADWRSLLVSSALHERPAEVMPHC